MLKTPTVPVFVTSAYNLSVKSLCSITALIVGILAFLILWLAYVNNGVNIIIIRTHHYMSNPKNSVKFLGEAILTTVMTTTPNAEIYFAKSTIRIAIP